MVYKKIANKIPSLSSLLLAGVLLGTSDCGKKNKAEAEAPVVNGNDSSSSSNNNKQVNEPVKPVQKLSADLAEAVKGFKKIFMDSLGLGYLNTNVELMKLDVSDQPKPRLMDNLKVLCDIISNKNASLQLFPVPENLKDSFLALQYLPSTDSAQKYTFACLSAVQEIYKAFQDFYNVKQKFFKAIEDGAPQALVSTSIKELDRLIKGAEANFEFSRRFVDNSKGVPAILEGPRLARFLNGKSKKGTTYQEVTNLLGEKLSEIWVKFKEDKDKIPAADQQDVNRNGVLRKRGTAIMEHWKVDGGGKKDRMPKIDGIDNSTNKKNSKLEKKYMDITGSEAKLQVGTDQLFVDIAASNVKPSLEAALQANDITMGQLLFFTLARGNSGYDFITLSPSSTDTVKFVTHNEKYAAWQKEVKAGNQDFAKFIGKHIENTPELQNLFIIPNQDTIEKTLFQNVDQSKAANAGGTQYAAAVTAANNVAASAEVPLVLDPNSESFKLHQNILRLFSPVSQKISQDPTEVRGKVKELGDLLNNDDAKKSDLTFSQWVAIKIANEISKPAHRLLISDTADKSAEKLMTFVKNLVEDCAKSAIVKIKSGNYCPTSITDRIRDAFYKFDHQLGAKYNNASVTYDNITQELVTKSTTNKFDIDTIRETFVLHCEDFKGVVETNEVDVIQLPINIKVDDYAARFPKIKNLSAVYYPSFDKIRKEYHDKSSK